MTAVNDAPAGTNNTVTTLEDTAYTFARGRLRLQRSERQPGQYAAGGEDHHAAGRGHADRQRRRWSTPASSSRWPTSPAGKLVFTPAANANGAGYASFTFQVQDDGGTANGGVDLDPVAEHDDASTSPRSTMRRRGRTTRSPRWRTRPTRSRRPTSASAIRTTARPIRCCAVKITTLPASGHADRQRRGGHRRPVRHAWPTSRRAT